MDCGCIGIIPARADSTRFPNKILARIHGKPMVQYVWEAAKHSRRITKVIVATDSQAIAREAEGFGAEVMMTGSHFRSGSDRVAYVAKKMPFPLVVGLQGDEPLIRPHMIDALVEGLISNPDTEMATLAVRKHSAEELRDPNVVKVLVSQSKEALYFSRQPLKMENSGQFLKHIGIYAFREKAILSWPELQSSNLEQVESLEQLRALENGYKIRVVEVTEDTIGVDVPSDLARVESFLASPTVDGPGVNQMVKSQLVNT